MITQSSFYWLARVGGGLSGVYESLAPGGHSFISDTPDLASGYEPLPFPDWFPRKVYIPRIIAGYACSTKPAPESINEMTVWVDPKGLGYSSAQGAESGADFTRDISLVQHITSDQYVFVTRNFNHPILCDRDAGDKLAVSVGLGTMISWLYVEFCFLNMPA